MCVLCLTEVGGPSEEELLQLLDQCDLSTSRCATPNISPAPSVLHHTRLRESCSRLERKFTYAHTHTLQINRYIHGQAYKIRNQSITVNNTPCTTVVSQYVQYEVL